MNLEERRDYTEMTFRGVAMSSIHIKYCKCCGAYLYDAKIPAGDTKTFAKMFDDYLSGHVCLLRSVTEYEKGGTFKDLYEKKAKEDKGIPIEYIMPLEKFYTFSSYNYNNEVSYVPGDVINKSKGVVWVPPCSKRIKRYFYKNGNLLYHFEVLIPSEDFADTFKKNNIQPIYADKKGKYNDSCNVCGCDFNVDEPVNFKRESQCKMPTANSNKTIIDYISSLEHFSVDNNIVNSSVDEAEFVLRLSQLVNNIEFVKREWNELDRKRSIASKQIGTLSSSDSSYNAKKELISVLDSEIQKQKEILKELIECKNAYMSTGIIHPKYVEIVAINTICEYFETYRIESLKGIHGAYNLYESEMRQNVIISKLDDILASLDEIKNIQYRICSVLSSINSGINALSSKMDTLITTTNSINANTSNIAFNTAKTAFYQEQTAYYSKITSERTEALCWITALK